MTPPARCYGGNRRVRLGPVYRCGLLRGPTVWVAAPQADGQLAPLAGLLFCCGRHSVKLRV